MIRIVRLRRNPDGSVLRDSPERMDLYRAQFGERVRELLHRMVYHRDRDAAKQLAGVARDYYGDLALNDILRDDADQGIRVGALYASWYAGLVDNVFPALMNSDSVVVGEALTLAEKWVSENPNNFSRLLLAVLFSAVGGRGKVDYKPFDERVRRLAWRVVTAHRNQSLMYFNIIVVRDDVPYNEAELIVLMLNSMERTGDVLDTLNTVFSNQKLPRAVRQMAKLAMDGRLPNRI